LFIRILNGLLLRQFYRKHFTLTINLPMMDDAQVQFSMQGMVSYTSAASVEDIANFYREKLTGLGWTQDSSMEYFDETGGLMVFNKDGSGLTISISVDNGETTVNLISDGN